MFPRCAASALRTPTVVSRAMLPSADRCVTAPPLSAAADVVRQQLQAAGGAVARVHLLTNDRQRRLPFAGAARLPRPATMPPWVIASAVASTLRQAHAAYTRASSVPRPWAHRRTGQGPMSAPMAGPVSQPSVAAGEPATYRVRPTDGILRRPVRRAPFATPKTTARRPRGHHRDPHKARGRRDHPHGLLSR